MNSPRRTAGRVKPTIDKILVRPAMMDGLENLKLAKRQKAELDKARFLIKGIKTDMIGNVYLKDNVQVGGESWLEKL